MDEKNFVDGTSGAQHVTGAPLTTENAAVASPSLVSNAIDSAIVRIRPMATPLDQISRMGHTRAVDSMEVDYYSVDTRADRDSVESVQLLDDVEGASDQAYAVKVAHPNRFEVSDTLTCAGTPGQVVMYVAEKRHDGVLVCYSAGEGDVGQGRDPAGRADAPVCGTSHQKHQLLPDFQNADRAERGNETKP